MQTITIKFFLAYVLPIILTLISVLFVRNGICVKCDDKSCYYKSVISRFFGISLFVLSFIPIVNYAFLIYFVVHITAKVSGHEYRLVRTNFNKALFDNYEDFIGPLDVVTSKEHKKFIKEAETTRNKKVSQYND